VKGGFRVFLSVSAVGVEARKARAEKHLDRAIIGAETWSERDKLFRRLAAQCYETVRWFKKNGDYKQAAKWMSLVLRFLRLSLDPKSKQEMDQVMRELEELKATVKEQEEKKEAQQDIEDSG